MPLVPVLKDMELRGIALDKGKLHQLSKSFDHQLQEIEQQIYALAGENFNINLSNLTQLETLSINYCENFLGKGIENLINAEDLYVYQCPKFIYNGYGRMKIGNNYKWF